MNKVLVIHGPNLNMLGERDVKHYGVKTLNDINNLIKKNAKLLGLEVECYQSNVEGDIVSKIHEALDYTAIIINPGAYTHYSYAIRDAIDILNIPVIEVHLSNVYKREGFRKESVIAPVCTGQVSGLGYISYLVALDGIKKLIEEV